MFGQRIKSKKIFRVPVDRICLFLTFIFLPVSALYSQSGFQGVVTDVLNGELLDRVLVRSVDMDSLATTNSLGFFRIEEAERQESEANELRGELSAYAGSLVWNFNSRLNIRIIDASGRLKFAEDDMPPSGSLSVGFAGEGMYIVRIGSGSESRLYYLFSYGGESITGQRKESRHDSGEWEPPDTLVLERNGYFNQKVPYVKSEDYDIRYLRMLKKEYEELDYFSYLLGKPAFSMISSSPSKTFFGEMESVKVLIDKNTDIVYYMDSEKYASHYLFASLQLGYPYNNSQFNYYQYRENPERYLYSITMNFYRETGLYTFEYFSGDEAGCDRVKWAYDRIIATSELEHPLYFYSTNDSWKNCSDVPTITANELYEGQNFQALNSAVNYGYLQKVSIDDIDNASLQRHDIVLVDGIPLDLPVVAGIITTEFQSPLSHINVLSHNRGTPNMALRDGFSDSAILDLVGKLVYYEVNSDSFIIRQADPSEAQAYWALNEPSVPVVLQKDVSASGLTDLDDANISFVNKIGAKAANFAEVLNAFETAGIAAPVPEVHFAIPFYYYEKHLQKSGLDTYIAGMLENEDFKSDSETRKSMLAELRDSIISTALDQELLNLVLSQLGSESGFRAFRFRSSTNAEDLEGFNGAGLYSSYTGSPGDPEKPVDLAIKLVWASLWNFSAFEEREYFRINHLSCSMAVLVHRSFPSEDANGVAVTRNLYNINRGYVVNVQFGEISVVDPQPGVINDHLIIYDFTLSGDDPYTLEYTNHSNVAGYGTGHVMTDDELFQLGHYLDIIKSYFYSYVYDCSCSYNDFGLDVEFKVDSEVSPRKIYIKQVRPY